jgi:hypothetical protein
MDMPSGMRQYFVERLEHQLEEEKRRRENKDS